MAKLSMDCKKLMVKEVSDRLNKRDILIVTNYRGLSAKDLNELRKELRNVSGEYMVVKDSMAKRALAGGSNNRIAEFIEGEVGIAIDKTEDPTYISKVLVKFSKDHEVLKIRGGIIKGELISKEDIAALAALPSREVLLGKLANVLNAPIQGLAGALSAIISKVVYALNAVKEKKEKAGEDKGEPKGEKAEEKKEGVKEEVLTAKKETGQPEKKAEAPAEKRETEQPEKQPEKKERAAEEAKTEMLEAKKEEGKESPQTEKKQGVGAETKEEAQPEKKEENKPEEKKDEGKP